jgi:hypothetical protein
MRIIFRTAAIVFLIITMQIVRSRANDVPYGVGDWPESFGNHRARVQVAEKADAVWAHIPWRRRDANPQNKEIIVVEAATGKRIDNVLRVRVDNENGDLLFQPPAAGEYYIYYLPFRTHGCIWWPTTVYPPPTDAADVNWKQTCLPLAEQIKQGKTDAIPTAKLVEFQAINEHHRFDPMELPATAAEMQSLLAANAERPYLVFPEDRSHPIRMDNALPLRWIKSGPSAEFSGAACRNEYYAFQLGVFAARQELKNLSVRFAPLKSKTEPNQIPAEAITCINLGGIDCFGNPMTKIVNVPQGRVQPLWIGVDVPRDAVPGEYQGEAVISADGLPETTVKIKLNVTDELLEDRGDGQPWRHSRLRWLNSRIGIDNETFGAYPPVKFDDWNFAVLGRRGHVAETGLLDSVQSTFGFSVDTTEAPPREVLAGPMKVIVETAAGPIAFTTDKPKLISKSNGVVEWESVSRADGLTLRCRGRMQCDGWFNYTLGIHAEKALELTNARLEIPFRRDVAKYLMGMGHKGGRRLANWRWNPAMSIPSVWIGDINAGLFYKGWGYHGQPPQDGGAEIVEQGDAVVLSQTTGPRNLAPGGEAAVQFGMMLTPTKVLDKRHWQWRYYHRGSDTAEAAAFGAKIMNFHHGLPQNPYINYPFLTVDSLSKLANDAHARGVKLKLYYTLRELTSFTTEFWALRSLGDEVFPAGPGFQTVSVPADAPAARPMVPENDLAIAGKDPSLQLPPTGNSWLAEHVIDRYYPAWHHPFGNGRCDAAIVTNGNTRWNNYYLEGLAWLVRNVGIDGLYLDDFSYDHDTMKRVRKTLDRNRPGCLIDLHSNNLQGPSFRKSPATFYIEHMSMIDSLWFGELFDYNETPDFWLLEISGIPFGLFGEMLQGGGNPWRGMVYGMTNRIYSGDPREIWKLWDRFGIAEARMIGYWDPACPVRTGRDDVPATVYAKPGQTLVALASWSPQVVDCKLEIDWKALGLDPAKAKITAWKVENFQPAAEFRVGEKIPVQPGRGWLLVLHD